MSYYVREQLVRDMAEVMLHELCRAKNVKKGDNWEKRSFDDLCQGMNSNYNAMAAIVENFGFEDHEAQVDLARHAAAISNYAAMIAQNCGATSTYIEAMRKDMDEI